MGLFLILVLIFAVVFYSRNPQYIVPHVDAVLEAAAWLWDKVVEAFAYFRKK